VFTLCDLHSPAHADRIYKCVDDRGNAVFSQTRCSSAAQSLNVQVSRPDARDTQASQDRWANIIQQQDAVRDARNRAVAERTRLAQEQIEGAARQKATSQELEEKQAFARIRGGCGLTGNTQDFACRAVSANQTRANWRLEHGLEEDEEHQNTTRTQNVAAPQSAIRTQNRLLVNGVPATSVGGGNYIDNGTGNFLQGAAGGVIDTKTGQFMPTH
jgi:hypothetical protein